MSDSSTIVSKVWNYAHVLRDFGIGYNEYVQQITYLLFLKLVHDRADLVYYPRVPKNRSWGALNSKPDKELVEFYDDTLLYLSKKSGFLKAIFQGAANKIRRTEHLRHLLDLIDQDDWSNLPTDIKGELYEGILEKNAQDTKKGAGQYFTPRSIVNAIVQVTRPKANDTVCDPACGTGGFLLTVHEYRKNSIRGYAAAYDAGKDRTLFGTELVLDTAKLCTMNLYLHGVGGSFVPITVGDALEQPSARKYDLILTNPPFGVKSSITVIGDDQKKEAGSIDYQRPEFWATTSNKQLNFLQHIFSELKTGGTAAVVLPDNVLFEGGAGETIRRELLKRCNVHTLLRLPTGIFYAQGVKANVLFFERKAASKTPWTKDLWIYDLRTNQHFTLKTNPLATKDLEDFIKVYQSGKSAKRKETDRFKKFTYDEIVAQDKANLDIFWLKDESLEDTENLPPPTDLAAEIVESLEAALAEFRTVEESLSIKNEA